jgi:hypothetical protein
MLDALVLRGMAARTQYEKLAVMKSSFACVTARASCAR